MKKSGNIAQAHYCAREVEKYEKRVKSKADGESGKGGRKTTPLYSNIWLLYLSSQSESSLSIASTLLLQ